MAQIDDDGPHILIAQYPFGRRHAGRREPVLDDPLELTVGVSLYHRQRERRHRGGHLGREGNAGSLPIATMAHNTVESECHLASFYLLRCAGNRIYIVLATHCD